MYWPKPANQKGLRLIHEPHTLCQDNTKASAFTHLLSYWSAQNKIIYTSTQVVFP